jgi:hypothetical protein
VAFDKNFTPNTTPTKMKRKATEDEPQKRSPYALPLPQYERAR